MNQNFKDYNFSAAVKVIYDFWLYELCDVYLELIKPRMKLPANIFESTCELSEAEKNAIWSSRKTAQDVLYTCLDYGLRLLSPMCPFVCEELYQRLPASPAKSESIAVSSYPLGVISWADEACEKKMAVAASIAAGLRSSMAQLQVLPKMNPQA